jgi:hypothetical protein
MGVDLHEPLSLELHQCLADRNPADAELHGQGLLSELEACLELAINNAAAQLPGHRG